MEVAKGGITSVVATPDRSTVVAAAADGSLSLIELRKPGACLAKILCLAASPLQCCRTDGDTALASSLSGQVCIFSQRHKTWRLQRFHVVTRDWVADLCMGHRSAARSDAAGELQSSVA